MMDRSIVAAWATGASSCSVVCACSVDVNTYHAVGSHLGPGYPRGGIRDSLISLRGGVYFRVTLGGGFEPKEVTPPLLSLPTDRDAASHQGAQLGGLCFF